MKRNRKTTELRFLDAVHSIFMEKGFDGLGVNAVAAKAGANKVLIYRYFGSLEGLLELYIERMDPFPRLTEKVKQEIGKKNEVSVAEVSTIIFTALEQEIRTNQAFAQMLKWEIASSHPLTKRIAASREENGKELTRFLKENYHYEDSSDVQAVLAVLTGGLFYLWIRSGTVDVFNGVPLNTDTGRKRLLTAATAVVRTIFSQKK